VVPCDRRRPGEAGGIKCDGRQQKSPGLCIASPVPGDCFDIGASQRVRRTLDPNYVTERKHAPTAWPARDDISWQLQKQINDYKREVDPRNVADDGHAKPTSIDRVSDRIASPVQNGCYVLGGRTTSARADEVYAPSVALRNQLHYRTRLL
jgi:hypothetical protein